MQSDAFSPFRSARDEQLARRMRSAKAVGCAPMWSGVQMDAEVPVVMTQQSQRQQADRVAQSPHASTGNTEQGGALMESWALGTTIVALLALLILAALKIAHGAVYRK